MPQPPAFQFYASDYLSSSKVQLMTLEAEGAYIRLLAYSWQDGFIPLDIPKLARMCKTTPKKMQSLWDGFLAVCFVLNSAGNGYVNVRLEGVRSGLIDYKGKQSSSGKLGAEARWKGKQTDGTAIDSPLASGMANDSSPSPSPSSSPSPKEGKQKGKKQGDSPGAEKRAGRPDPAADSFSDAYSIHVGSPYGWNRAGFVNLAALRNRYGLQPLETPPNWPDALINYFASPLSKYSLEDFCARYDTFKNGPIDRYNKPVNHSGANGNGTKNRADKNAEAAQRILARLDPEDRRSHERGTAGGEPVDLPGADDFIPN